MSKRIFSRWPVGILVVLLSSLTLNVQAASPLAGPAHSPDVPSQASPRKMAAPDLVPGSKLVFQSTRNGNWEVYTANDDGSAQTRLTTRSAVDNSPRFNRGCTLIVFATTKQGNFDIYTMNPDGTGEVQLTVKPTDDYSPAWSPDGTRIVFVATRDGNEEIYVMNADGTGQTRLTFDATHDQDPSWSPDGGKILFTSNRSGEYRIWVMNADGSGQAMLSNQFKSADPAWSPDGTQIAYDADANSDGWQEIWLMNADGSNQREVYDPGTGAIDARPRSWSPDGRYIAFTYVSYELIDGSWIPTAAYLDAWDSKQAGVTVRLVDTGYDWKPDWQTVDLQAPTSSVAALPTQSVGPFTVYWSGYDDGPAGLRNFDVQFKDGAGGTWVTWLTGITATAALFPGVGGHTYYLRSRATDNAYNVESWPAEADAVTTVEAMHPKTAVKTLPRFCRGTEFWINWGGVDPGGSGISGYDVQYRDSAAGTWTDLLLGTANTSYLFSGTAGHTYDLRCRAEDYATNLEPWPTNELDTSTTLYTWAVSGTVWDNRETLLSGGIVSTTPGAFLVIPSSEDQGYFGYVAASASTYLVSPGRPGYGYAWPASLSSSQDGHYDAILPPADNSLRNWGFETGSLGAGDWQTGGLYPPGVTNTRQHSGSYAARLGCQLAVFTAPWNISNSPGQSSYPKLALDGSGALHVVWDQTGDGVTGEIYYARRDSAGNWSGVYHLTNTPATAGPPQIAVDGTGIVHVVWAENPDGSSSPEIFHAWRATNGTWSSPQNISSDAGSSSNPQLAVDASGVVHLVWQDDTPGNSEIYYAQRTSGGTWSSPQNISNSSGESQQPQLAVEGSGVVHVAWTELADNTIYYAWRTGAGTWYNPIKISSNVEDCGSPQLALDGNGVLHAVWSGEDDIYYAGRATTGAWSPPQNISNNPEPSGTPQLAAETGGVVHAIWPQQPAAGTNVELYYARRDNTGTWSSPQNISQTSGESDSPQMAVGGGGTLHVIWSDKTPGKADVYYIRRESNGVWSALASIQNSGRSEYPRLVAEGSRTIHVVWQDDTVGAYVVYYSQAIAAEQSGDSSISQSTAVPILPSVSTLSFFYELEGASPTSGSWLSIEVDNGAVATTLFSTTSSINSWTHRWIDLTSWAGQTITVTLNVHQTASRLCTRAYLDAVSLGTTYSDLWIRQAGETAAMPGTDLVYTLSYGNRGGAPASNVWITTTLPAEVSFVGADPAPVFLIPSLRWQIGAMPAWSGPYPIIVTVTVDPAAPAFDVFTTTTTIGTITTEWEKNDNTTWISTLVGSRVYLPLVTKMYYR